MAQPVMCLLCKHGDRSLGPQYPHEYGHTGLWLYLPVLGEAEMGISLGLPASQPIQSFDSRERPCLKNYGRKWRRQHPGFTTGVYM